MENWKNFLSLSFGWSISCALVWTSGYFCSRAAHLLITSCLPAVRLGGEVRGIGCFLAIVLMGWKKGDGAEDGRIR